MKNRMNMFQKNKQYFSHVIPAVLAFAFSGVYVIVDGLFVGNRVGDIGLATINIAYPAVSLMQAAGTGIGLGGAIQYSIRAAEGKKEEQEQYFSGTLILLFLSGILIMLCALFWLRPLLTLLGAAGQVLNMGEAYLKVILLGTLFQVFGTGLLPMIRNMGGSVFAMLIMIAGFCTNIVLDFLFVWVLPYGIAGAAAATVTGQGVTVAGCLFFFLRKKARFSLPPANCLKKVFAVILKVAVSPFGLTFSPTITLIFMNKFTMAYGGESAVAAYACISYVITIIYLLLQGVGDGSQPLLSRYYGERAQDMVRSTCRLAYWTAGIMAAVCMAGLYALRTQIPVLFGASEEVSRMVAEVLPLFLAGFVCLAYVRVTTSYMYATEKNVRAYILVYAEPVFLLLFLFLLPPFLKLDGIWYAVLASQLATALTAAAVKAALRPPIRRPRADC